MSCKWFLMRLHTSCLYKANKKVISTLFFLCLIPIAINCHGRLKLCPSKDLDGSRCVLWPLNFRCLILESSVLSSGSLAAQAERCFSTESQDSRSAERGPHRFSAGNAVTDSKSRILPASSLCACLPKEGPISSGQRPAAVFFSFFFFFFLNQLERVCLWFTSEAWLVPVFCIIIY